MSCVLLSPGVLPQADIRIEPTRTEHAILELIGVDDVDCVDMPFADSNGFDVDVLALLLAHAEGVETEVFVLPAARKEKAVLLACEWAKKI